MKYKILILFAIFQVVSFTAIAQDHLRIKTIFDTCGKRKGSVFVQLSSDILSQGSHITLYKSLVVEGDESLAIKNDILEAIEEDLKNGVKISEQVKNGEIISGSYYLGSQKLTRRKVEHEYILYKYKSKKITLVYLKGNFSPKELDNELKKLKDLIIYVNNKRIKLQ